MRFYRNKIIDLYKFEYNSEGIYLIQKSNSSVFLQVLNMPKHIENLISLNKNQSVKLLIRFFTL